MLNPADCEAWVLSTRVPVKVTEPEKLLIVGARSIDWSANGTPSGR